MEERKEKKSIGSKDTWAHAHAHALKINWKHINFDRMARIQEDEFHSTDIKFVLAHKYLMWVMSSRIRADALLHYSWILHFFIWKAIKMPYKFYHLLLADSSGCFAVVGGLRNTDTEFMNSKAHFLPLYHHGILTIIIYNFIFKGHWLSNLFGMLLRSVEWKCVSMWSKTTYKLNLYVVCGMNS